MRQGGDLPPVGVRALINSHFHLKRREGLLWVQSDFLTADGAASSKPRKTVAAGPLSPHLEIR